MKFQRNQRSRPEATWISPNPLPFDTILLFPEDFLSMIPATKTSPCRMRVQTLRRRVQLFPRRYLRPLIAALVVFTVLCLEASSIAQSKARAQSEPPLPQDFNQYPGLLPEFGQLFEKLQRDVKFPPPRSQSRLLPLLPESTTLYAAFPNYGEASHQAHSIFESELQQSSALRDWWQHGDMAANGTRIEAYLDNFYQFSQYLGDEIVVSATVENGKNSGLLIVAEVRKPGLKDLLATMSKDLSANTKMPVRVLDIRDLATTKGRSNGEEFLILVRPDFVVAALDIDTLRKFNSRLDQGSHEFASNPFSQRVTQAYDGGVTVVAAADLQRLLKQLPIKTSQDQAMFQRSGFAEAKYLVWEHNNVAGQSASQIELSFTGPRRGVASWLAAPGPLGGLDFISPHTMLAGAVLLKNPAEIFDDIRDLASASNPKAFSSIEQMEQALKLSLKEDILRPLAGEFAYGIENLTQGTPTWKIILRVNDPDHLQRTLSALLATTPVNARQSEEGGVTYHTLQIPSAQKPTEIGYAFVDGYLVIASSRQAVAEAVRVHRSGDSLGKSKKFLAALPPGQLAEVSGLFYEDPIAMAALNMQPVSPEIAAVFAHAGGESTPVVVCAYGEETSLREASRSGGADAGAILIGAAIAIPNLLRSRMAANDASAVASIRTVNTAQVAYSAIYPQKGFARDLAALGPDPAGRAPSADHATLVDATLADPTCTAGNWCTKSGFRFTISTACKKQRCDEYVVVGSPVSSNTGSKNICSTSDAVVRFKPGPPLVDSIRPSECRAWSPLE